jgi:hypothetical protein
MTQFSLTSDEIFPGDSFMDEDLITAIFLQYIGAAWAAHFKHQFTYLYYLNNSTEEQQK